MEKNRIAWIATDTGAVRAGNEDRCFAGAWIGDGRDGIATIPLPEHFWSAAVADGMGGHEAGELASETAIDALRPMVSRMIGPADVGAIIDSVNEQIFEAMYSARGKPGMGSTIVAVVVERNQAIFFNVGDSRAYILRDNALLQQSTDDTLDRGNSFRIRNHSLTQSLGGTLSRLPISAHVNQVSLMASDRILICSDGLTDMLPDVKILEILATQPHHPAQALVSAALGAGGRDNVTVVVIDRLTALKPENLAC